jgi:hypothetical protein
MITPEHALLTLLSHAEGDAVGVKVYPEEAPQEAVLPWAVYSIVSQTEEYHLRGTSGIGGTRFQLDVYAATLKAAGAIAEAYRLALAGWRGTVTGSDGDTLKVEHVRCENSAGGFVDPSTGEQFGIHRRTCDYLMRHAVALPVR